MGKNDWARLADTEELASVGVSPHRGRGWKVLSGLLLVGSATFALAYYVPLYRAHSRLRAEYKATSTEAADFRKQLADTVATLNQTTDDCAKLRAETHQHGKNTAVLVSHAERLEKNLQAPLKKFQGKGRLTLERQEEKLRVTLSAPALVAPTGGDLTDAGKKALCAVGSSLKDADYHVVVQGQGVAKTDKTSSAWQMAATRAGNAAHLLSNSCGVDSSRIEVAVKPAAAGTAGAAIALEITPTS
jgi:flagellar motor protein MotB